jgi:exopolysaccharide production protein ExoQ
MGPRLIAALFCAVFIICIFSFVRDRTVRTTKALWLAVLWLGTGASRNLSEWMHLSQPDSADRYLEGSPVDRLYLFGLLAAGIVVLLGRKQQVRAVLRANNAILLYFCYCGISAVWSGYPDVSAKRWIRSLGDIVMVLIVVTEPEWLHAVNRLFARVGFVLIPVSVLFIRYFPEYGRTYSRGGAPAWTGVTTDKNALGMICLIFGLAFTWNFLRVYYAKGEKTRSRQLILYGCLGVMAGWLIHESNSATSLVCWIIGGTIMVLTTISRQARKAASIHVMVGGALTVIICAMFLNTGSSLVQTIGRDSTFTGRTAIWSCALPEIPNPVVGAGFESFWLGPRLRKIELCIDQGVNEAHNGYIEVYLNLGWVGVAALLAILITGYGNIVAAVRRQGNASNLALAFFVAAVIYNLSEAAYKMMSPMWIALLLAMTVAQKSRFQRSYSKAEDVREISPVREYFFGERDPAGLGS